MENQKPIGVRETFESLRCDIIITLDKSAEIIERVLDFEHDNDIGKNFNDSQIEHYELALRLAEKVDSSSLTESQKFELHELIQELSS